MSEDTLLEYEAEILEEVTEGLVCISILGELETSPVPPEDSFGGY